MDSFYMYAVSFALIILIIVLVIMGLVMSKMTSTSTFPPIQNACPDYWLVDSSNNCTITSTGTVNKGSLPVCDGSDSKFYINDVSTNNQCVSIANSTNYMLPTIVNDSFGVHFDMKDSAFWSSKYPGMSTICAKKQWATRYGIVWDGITNYTAC